jgi:hypothetical protein
LHSLPDSLDIESVGSVVHLQSELQSAAMTIGNPFNIYIDTNVLEAKKAASMAIVVKDCFRETGQKVGIYNG